MGEENSCSEVSDQYLKVIGAGWGRTCTKSIQLALQRLGLKTYHTATAVEAHGLSHFKVWENLGKGNVSPNKAFEQLFKEHGYQATLDFPACMFYKELLKVNPEAKVILTVRDSPEQWYESARRVSLRFHESLQKYESLGLYLFYRWNPIGRMFYEAFDATYLNHFHDVSNKTATMIQYEQWINEVKANVPKTQLLVFNARDGWDPLCEFLQVPEDMCPSKHGENFPRTSETYLNTVSTYLVEAIGYLTVLLPLVFVFLLLVLLKRHTSISKR